MIERLTSAKEKYVEMERACIREELEQIGDVDLGDLPRTVYDNCDYIPSSSSERAKAYGELCRLLRENTFLYPVDSHNDPICDFEDGGALKLIPVFTSKAEAELGDYADAALNFVSIDGLVYLMERYGITLAFVDGDGNEPLRLYKDVLYAIAAEDYKYSFILGV